MLLVQGRISQKNMAFSVAIGLAVLGSQGIVVKCTAAIFFRKVDKKSTKPTLACLHAFSRARFLARATSD